MHDHRVDRGKREDVLTELSARHEGAGPFRAGARRGDPPQISVAELAAPGRARRHVLAGAFLDPIRRNDLLVVPASAARHHEPKSRHVARRQEQVIGEIARLVLVAHHALTLRIEVLQRQRLREVLGERVEHALAGLLLEHRAEDIEVPVVIEEIRARLLSSALRLVRAVARAARRVIDAGACDQEVAHARGLLDRQQAVVLVDAEVSHGGVEIDRAVGDIFSVQHRQDAFARGGEIAHLRDVAVAVGEAAGRDDHQRGGRHRDELRLRGFETRRAKAGAERDVPVRAGKRRGRGCAALREDRHWRHRDRRNGESQRLRHAPAGHVIRCRHVIHL